MNKEIYILGGARTPMADYTGKLKDFSALDLGGAGLARGDGADGRGTGDGRPRRLRQRPADELGCRLRRAPCRAQGRRADRGAGADGQSALRLRHSVGHQRRADDPARRGRRRAGRRHREHEPGAARHPRAAKRPAPRAGPARGLPLDLAPRPATAAARWPAPPRTARRSTASRARSRIATRSAASSSPMPRGRRAALPTKSCRSRSRRRKGVEVFAADDHMRPDSTLEGLAKLPAAFSKNGCVTAGNASRHRRRRAPRSCSPPSAAVKTHGLTPLGAADALGDGRRRAVADGDGPGAGDAQGARARRV